MIYGCYDKGHDQSTLGKNVNFNLYVRVHHEKKIRMKLRQKPEGRT